MVSKQSNTFNALGTLARDGNRIPIGWGNKPSTVDATATPVKSPITTVSTTVASTLTIPGGATQVTLSPAVDMRVSEDSAMASYAVIYAKTSVRLDVTEQDLLYFKADSSAGALSFIFNIL